jgi:hypothetical protein
MRRIKTVLCALGIAMAMVVSLDYMSFAASGHSFILGRSNYANTQTTLTRTTAGAALGLYTRTGSAPLRITQPVRVPNLNADLVDGYSSERMVNQTRVYTQSISTSGTSGFTVTLADVPAGYYQTTYNAWVYGPANSSIACWLNVPSTGQYLEDWTPGNANGFFPTSQAGVVTVPTTQNLVFTCNGATSDWSTFSGQPVQVALSPIGLRLTGTSTAARPLVSGRSATR